MEGCGDSPLRPQESDGAGCGGSVGGHSGLSPMGNGEEGWGGTVGESRGGCLSPGISLVGNRRGQSPQAGGFEWLAWIWC